MPHLGGMEHSVEVRDGLGRVHYRGEFTVEGFTAAFERLLQDPGFQSGMPCVWDCTEATGAGIDAGGLETIGRLVQKNAARRGPGKTAVVAGEGVVFGMARMYDLMLDGRRENPFQVFRNMADARAWLSAPAD